MDSSDATVWTEYQRRAKLKRPELLTPSSSRVTKTASIHPDRPRWVRVTVTKNDGSPGRQGPRLEHSRLLSIPHTADWDEDPTNRDPLEPG